MSLGFLSSRGVPDPHPHLLLQRLAPELIKVGKIINTFKVLSATLMILSTIGGALGKFGWHAGRAARGKLETLIADFFLSLSAVLNFEHLALAPNIESSNGDP